MDRYKIEVTVYEGGAVKDRREFEHPAPAEANSRDELIWGALYGDGKGGAIRYLESLAPAFPARDPDAERPNVDV